MSTSAPISAGIKAIAFATLASALLGALSGWIPLPVILIALFALYAIFGAVLFMGVHGGKLRKIVIALISAFLSVTAMWAAWTWVIFGAEDAVYFLTGGPDAFKAVWNAATQTEMSLSRVGNQGGVTVGSGLLTTTAILTSIAVAFPPLIWGLLAGSTLPSDDTQDAAEQ